MMQIAQIWAITAIPWIAGFYLGLNCPLKNTSWHMRLVFASASAFLALVGIGAVSFALTHIGKPSLTLVTPFFAAVLALQAFLSVRNSNYGVGIRNDCMWKNAGLAVSTNLLVSIFSILAALHLAEIMYNASLVPTFAWDPLWYKAQNTIEFINNNLASEIAPWPYNYKSFHPSVVEASAAWGAWTRVSLGASGPSHPFWIFTILSMLGVVFAYNAYTSDRIQVGLLAAVVTVSIPLLENHALLGGYSEIFICTAMTSSIALGILGLEIKSLTFLVTGCLIAFSIALLKNIGILFTGILTIFYAIIALRLLMTQRAGEKKAKIKLILFSAACVTLSAFMWILWSELRWTKDEIIFSHQRIKIDDINFLGIINNHITSSIENASFSILITFTALLSVQAVLIKKQRISLTAPLLLGFAVLCVLFGMQLTEYGYQNSLPGSDTGLSRMALIAVAPWLMCLGGGVRKASRLET